MEQEIITNIVLPLAGGGGIGFLMGYGLKKVFKIAAVIMGVFFGALMYLQSQGFLNVNWDKVSDATQGALGTLVNSAGNGEAQFVITNLGLPLTSGMVGGFIWGFSKG